MRYTSELKRQCFILTSERVTKKEFIFNHLQRYLGHKHNNRILLI